MKNITLIFSFLLFTSVTVLFSGCEKDEEYNFNDITPILVGGINGPAETFASGLAPVTYFVVGRGGSTFEWTVTGANASIEQDDEAYKAYVTFAQSDVDQVATITCIETTQGGKKSDPVSTEVQLYKFKAMAYDEFIGEWVGQETDGDGVVHDVTINIEATSDDNVIKFPVNAGTPSLMEPLFVSWGETFQAGIGNEGDIYAILDLNTGAVSIDCQYFGQTLPGPWDYYFSGSGTWEGITRSMTISYGLQWDETCTTNYNASTLTISKQ